MVGCGTTTFTEPGDCRLNALGVRVNLVLTACTKFKARVTWAHLGRLTLVRCNNSVAHVAFLAFTPKSLFISLPIRRDPPAIWAGVEMLQRDIVQHSLGERFHQRARGASRWGLISVSAEDLADYGWTIARLRLKPPPAAKFLRPHSKAISNLLRLHGQACRLVETDGDLIAHPEVARALEQELLHALVTCLTGEEAHRNTGTRRHRAEIMAKFEEVLASHELARCAVPELVAAVGVPERNLRLYCSQFLGMSPGRYARLRRLHLVRAALRRADTATASVGSIARQYGFSELGRFAVLYRLAFGEKPSTSLRGFRSAALAFSEFA
jgi:AraC-like DNA-binding protein